MARCANTTKYIPRVERSGDSLTALQTLKGQNRGPGAGRDEAAVGDLHQPVQVLPGQVVLDGADDRGIGPVAGKVQHRTGTRPRVTVIAICVRWPREDGLGSQRLV